MGNIYDDDILNMASRSGWRRTDSSEQDMIKIIRFVILFLIVSAIIGIGIYISAYKTVDDYNSAISGEQQEIRDLGE